MSMIGRRGTARRGVRGERDKDRKPEWGPTDASGVPKLTSNVSLLMDRAPKLTERGKIFHKETARPRINALAATIGNRRF